MAQLTVRSLSPDLVRLLKVRAAHNNRSAEAEHRQILETALKSDARAFMEQAARLREETRDRPFAEDGATLIRRDRDRDHEGLDS
jgi:antitoxin FitA